MDIYSQLCASWASSEIRKSEHRKAVGRVSVQIRDALRRAIGTDEVLFCPDPKAEKVKVDESFSQIVVPYQAVRFDNEGWSLVSFVIGVHDGLNRGWLKVPLRIRWKDDKQLWLVHAFIDEDVRFEIPDDPDPSQVDPGVAAILRCWIEELDTRMDRWLKGGPARKVGFTSSQG